MDASRGRKWLSKARMTAGIECFVWKIEGGGTSRKRRKERGRCITGDGCTAHCRLLGRKRWVEG